MQTDEGSWTDAWDALCVTVVASLTPTEAAQAIALADFSEFAGPTAAEAWVMDSETYDRSWFATGRVGAWTFIWESNGWQGATPEVALRAAGRGPLASMFWNVNSVMAYLSIDGGSVIRQFDPLFRGDHAAPTVEVGDPLAGEDGLDWETAPRLSGLALLGSLARVGPPDPSWLELPGTSFWGHRF